MIFGILDRNRNVVVSWYAGTRIAKVYPFATDNYFHFEVVEQYPEGYSFNESGSLEYDFSYKPNEPLPEDMTEIKLKAITDFYIEESRRFASANSIMMTQFGYTTEQKAAFVRKAIDSFKPIKEEIEMYGYYEIWAMFDAIVRDEILTEERIATLKSTLYAEIFS